MEINSNISVNIKAIREANSLNQADFGKIIDKGASLVSAYEKGISVPPLGVILRISNHFNINLDFLINGDFTNYNKNEINSIKNGNVNGNLITNLNENSSKVSKNDIEILRNEYGYFPDMEMVDAYLSYSESRLKNILAGLKSDLKEKIALHNNIYLIADKLKILNDDYYKAKITNIDEKKYLKSVMSDYTYSEAIFEDVRLKWITLIYHFESANEHLLFLSSNSLRYINSRLDFFIRLKLITFNDTAINNMSDEL